MELDVTGRDRLYRTLVGNLQPTCSARETTPTTSLIDYIYELQISSDFPNKGTGSRGEKEWPSKMSLLK